jgi:signal transduction histidine kinase
LLEIAELYGNENLDSNIFYKKEALKISEQHNLKTTPFIVSEIIKMITATNDYNEVIDFGQRYYQQFKEKKFIYDHLVIGSEIGYAYYALGKSDSSSHYYNYVISLANENDEKEKILKVKVLRKRASFYIYESTYDKAIIDLETAITLVDTTKYYDLYTIYATIADTYTQFGDYQKALNNFDKAAKFVEKTDAFLPKMHMLYSYADFYRVFKQYEKANEYALKGVKLAEANNQPYGEMILKSMLAKTYIDLNQFDSAKPHLEYVIEFGTKFQNNEIVAIAQYDLGAIANQNKDYNKALLYCNEAWQFFKETNIYIHKASTCSCLSDANQGLGNNSEALFYYKQAVAYTDSTNSKEQIKKIYRIQNKYDLEKKEAAYKAKELQQKLIARQKIKTKNQLIIGISIFGILLISLGFSVFKIKQRKREIEVAIQKEKAQELFSQQLLQSQEDEKLRISRELHDSVGQDLILLKNKAQLQNDQELEASITATLNNVREISQGLHPFVLEQFGLTSALKKIVNTIDTSTDIFITEEIENIDNLLLKQQELAVYRIVQEAITNIIKHAQSPSAVITAKKEANFIELLIKDYGKGFDWSEKSIAKDSLGMKTLHERAKILDAKLNIDSNTKKGTTLYLKIPINNA